MIMNKIRVYNDKEIEKIKKNPNVESIKNKTFLKFNSELDVEIQKGQSE